MSACKLAGVNIAVSWMHVSYTVCVRVRVCVWSVQFVTDR